MHRQTAHAILKTAFIEAGLNGHIATHSLRKSFAQRLYDKTGDIYLVQELLGHRNISTTQKYLGVNYADAKAAVEAIALISESDRNATNVTYGLIALIVVAIGIPAWRGKRDRDVSVRKGILGNL